MGIEDLNVDLSELAERVLVVTSNPKTATDVQTLLRSRSYHVECVVDLEEAKERLAKELYDGVVALFAPGDPELSSCVAELSSMLRLANVSLFLIHPQNVLHAADDQSIFGDRIQPLNYPYEPTALVVKLASQLRLRKLEANESRFYSKISTQNAELRDLTTRYKRELKEAQAIQQSILPTALPEAAGMTFAAAYAPLEVVGGDLYDVWKVDDDRFGFFLGDVTGHGLPAAFIGAMTKMALSYERTRSPDEMLTAMNSGLAPVLPDGRFVTVIALMYEVSTGVLKVARGGHPPALLWRAGSGEVEQLSPRGLPFGVDDGARYQLQTAVMNPGDKVLLLTDGITETANLDGEMLGVAGIAKIFATLAAESPIDQLLHRLLDFQTEYSGGRIIKDDVTLIGVERLQ